MKIVTWKRGELPLRRILFLVAGLALMYLAIFGLPHS